MNFQQIHTDAFTRIARLWRYLVAERESGRLLSLDEHVTIRPKGSLADVCLACPIPEFNTPEVARSKDSGKDSGKDRGKDKGKDKNL